MGRLTYEINKSAESLAKISHMYGTNVKAVIERHEFLYFPTLLSLTLASIFRVCELSLSSDVVQKLFENAKFDVLGLVLQDQS